MPNLSENLKKKVNNYYFEFDRNRIKNETYRQKKMSEEFFILRNSSLKLDSHTSFNQYLFVFFTKKKKNAMAIQYWKFAKQIAKQMTKHFLLMIDERIKQTLKKKELN